MRRRSLLLLFLSAVSACSGSTPEKPREICGNGKDDDSNGFTDCQDRDCAGQSGCPPASMDGGGNFGSCSRCGSSATKQTECLTDSYQLDTPPPECVGGKCQRLNTNVQVHYEVDSASLTGVTGLKALNTRIVSKRAVDGSAVSCATVRAQALGTTAVAAAQIENSGKFNLRGYDVSPVSANGGSIIRQPFVNIGTGADFLIWTELWGGPVDTATKLPSGNRRSWDCFETGPEVAEVVPSDHCAPAADAGPCRTIKVKLVNPPE